MQSGVRLGAPCGRERADGSHFRYGPRLLGDDGPVVPRRSGLRLDPLGLIPEPNSEADPVISDPLPQRHN